MARLMLPASPSAAAAQAAAFKTYSPTTKKVCSGKSCRAFSLIECVSKGGTATKRDAPTGNLVRLGALALGRDAAPCP